MKTRFFIAVFSVILFIGSCQKEKDFHSSESSSGSTSPENENSADTSETYSFRYNAVVLGINSDCYEWTIRVTQGADEVADTVGVRGMDDVYISRNLPDSLKQAGLNIKLNLRKSYDEELGICTMMGPYYPWITVLNAERE